MWRSCALAINRGVTSQPPLLFAFQDKFHKSQRDFVLHDYFKLEVPQQRLSWVSQHCGRVHGCECGSSSGGVQVGVEWGGARIHLYTALVCGGNTPKYTHTSTHTREQ